MQASIGFMILEYLFVIIIFFLVLVNFWEAEWWALLDEQAQEEDGNIFKKLTIIDY